MNDVLELIVRGDLATTLGGTETVLLVALLSFVIGHVIGWVYMWTHTTLSYSKMFVASLVVMPVLVALVMILMRGNIVIAFGLLAVFAVVRFRNVLKDTRDTKLFLVWVTTFLMEIKRVKQSSSKNISPSPVCISFFRKKGNRSL